MPSRAPKGFPKLDSPLPNYPVTSVVLRGDQGSLIGDWDRGDRGLPRVGSLSCPSRSSGPVQSDGRVSECIEQGLSCCAPACGEWSAQACVYLSPELVCTVYRAVPSGQGSQPAEGPCLSPIPCLHPQNTPMACATASLPCAPHPSRRPRAWPRMPGRSPGSPCVWRSSWARAASERCGWVRNTHPCPHPSQTAQGPWVPLSLIVSAEQLVSVFILLL